MPSNDAPRPQNWLVTYLPQDIWRIIFEICIRYNPRYFSQYTTLLFLCQVCSHWRRIATKAPELWCRIRVHISHSGSVRLRLKFLELLLERAGSMPLKISLSAAEPREEGKIRVSSETCGMIRKLFQNFRFADVIEIETTVFRLELPVEESLFDSLLSLHLPLLRSLTLGINGKSGSSIDPSISRLWTSSISPNLRRAIFPRCPEITHHGMMLVIFDYLFMESTLHIPFGQLTSVDIGLITPDCQLYYLFANAKNLVDCVVRQYHVSNKPFSEGGQPLMLPALQCLKLATTQYFFNVVSFLRYIHAPAMTELSLENAGPDWSHQAFASFLAKSSCSIQVFSIRIRGTTARELLDSLRLLTHVSSLTIKACLEGRNGCKMDSQFYGSFIKEMDQWDGLKKQFSLLPRLREIKIDNDIPRPTLFSEISRLRQLEVTVLNHSIETTYGRLRLK